MCSIAICRHAAGISKVSKLDYINILYIKVQYLRFSHSISKYYNRKSKMLVVDLDKIIPNIPF